jgi:hypothetical protein
LLRKALGSLVVTLAVPLSACGSGAYWDVQQKAPAYRVPEPVTLYILVSEQVNAADSNGAVLTAVETVEEELRAAGHRVRVVPGNRSETPPVPRVELEFQHFDGGDKVLRAMVGGNPISAYAFMPIVNPVALAGNQGATGRIVIDCYAVPATDGHVTFAGRVRGFVMSGDEFSSSREAGRLIAHTLLKEGEAH